MLTFGHQMSLFRFCSGLCASRDQNICWRRKNHGRPFVTSRSQYWKLCDTSFEMYSPADFWTVSPSVSFPVDMPPKDPCQKQACAIQQCLQGTFNGQSNAACCQNEMLRGRPANSVPRLQPTNTRRACVRTWSGRWGGAVRRKPGNPSAVLGSRSQNPRRTRVAHSLPWDGVDENNGGNNVSTCNTNANIATVHYLIRARWKNKIIYVITALKWLYMNVDIWHVVTKRPWYQYTFRVYVLLQSTCNM